MDTEQMTPDEVVALLDSAQTLTRRRKNRLRDSFLAEHDARVAAERERDERDEFWLDMVSGIKVLIEAHLDPVLSVVSGAVKVSDRDRLAQVLTELTDLPGLADEWQSENGILHDRLEAAEARAEQAERERDRFQALGEERQEDALIAEARVAALEAERRELRAALMLAKHHLGLFVNPDTDEIAGETFRIIDAVLGEQVAPTEPTCTGLAATWCPIHGDCTCDRDTEHDTGPDFASGEGTCPLHALASTHAAPQVAPEEEA